jgi:hypothetical protein
MAADSKRFAFAASGKKTSRSQIDSKKKHSQEHKRIKRIRRARMAECIPRTVAYTSKPEEHEHNCKGMHEHDYLHSRGIPGGSNMTPYSWKE